MTSAFSSSSNYWRVYSSRWPEVSSDRLCILSLYFQCRATNQAALLHPVQTGRELFPPHVIQHIALDAGGKEHEPGFGRGRPLQTLPMCVELSVMPLAYELAFVPVKIQRAAEVHTGIGDGSRLTVAFVDVYSSSKEIHEFAALIGNFLNSCEWLFHGVILCTRFGKGVLSDHPEFCPHSREK